jgi:hypothetical protein
LVNSEPIGKLDQSISAPSRRKLLKWLGGSYFIALLIPVTIYTVLSIYKGIFHADLLLIMIIGFPAAFFRSFRNLRLNIANEYVIAIGYAVYLTTAAACLLFRNTGNIWKIFLWTFLILLILNLVSCVPNAVMLGIEEIH